MSKTINDRELTMSGAKQPLRPGSQEYVSTTSSRQPPGKHRHPSWLVILPTRHLPRVVSRERLLGLRDMKPGTHHPTNLWEFNTLCIRWDRLEVKYRKLACFSISRESYSPYTRNPPNLPVAVFTSSVSNLRVAPTLPPRHFVLTDRLWLKIKTNYSRWDN